MTTADPYAADPYATTDTATTDYAVEEVAAPEEEAKNPTMLYFGYGLLHIWMAVLGMLIYTWYPKLMSSNSWWAAQCPATAWTTVTLATATTAGTAGCTGTATTAACPGVVLQTNNAASTALIQGWTLAKCQAAAPIS